VAVYVCQETGVLTCPWFRNLSPTYIAEFLAHYTDLPAARLIRGGADLARLTLPGDRVVEGRKPFLIPDVLSLPPDALTVALAKPEGYRALGVWPLIHEGRAIGLVGCYYDAPRTWSETEEEVYLAFCLQGAVALQNARLHDVQAERTAELEAFYARVLKVLPPGEGEIP
jgi:GAF domain-containing protein